MGKHARWLVTVLGAAVVGGATAGVVLASIPDSNGVIHGCYDNNKGTLSVIDTAAGGACTSKQTALNWNQTGPQGPAGPQGPQGPAGSGGAVAYGHIYFDRSTGSYLLDSTHSMNIESMYVNVYNNEFCIEVDPMALSSGHGVLTTIDGDQNVQGEGTTAAMANGITPDSNNRISEECTSGSANLTLAPADNSMFFYVY